MSSPPPPDVDPALLRSIAARVKSGQCILFLGAGVHSAPGPGSPYAYSRKLSPPRGRALSRYLARKSDYTKAFSEASRYDLQRVALHFETHPSFKRSDLVKEVRDAVQTGKEPSPALVALAEMNFPLVITTNYDQLFERALVRAGKEFIRGVYSPDDKRETRDIGDPDARKPYVLKIHGDVDEPSSIVITDEDYIQFLLRMSDKEQVNPIPLGFRYHLKRWPTLFVGYSLRDYNLRLLFKTLRWRVDPVNFPTSYAVDPYPDPLVVKVLSGRDQHISFISTDVWSFVPALYRAVMGKEMAS